MHGIFNLVSYLRQSKNCIYTGSLALNTWTNIEATKIMASTFASLISQLLIVPCLLLLSSGYLYVSEAQTPPLVSGLSYTFYNTSCPDFETIVRTRLQTEFASDIGLAAGLLRLHFHDCFVQVSTFQTYTHRHHNCSY